MVKPFSIQSPENIAQEYGGNKQKIAQAMQLGIVDSTAGVLAGMFIDRMRNAQTQESTNPPTVAQQVMGSAPPQGSPPMGAPPPMPPQGGPSMGAPPPMPSPDMGGMPSPEEPPMGMAEGGIVGLDIPDTLFDESSNGGFDDGYAGGGLVAFADGGMADLYNAVEHFESRGNPNAVSPKGARGVMQIMPGTARDPGFGLSPQSDFSEAGNREHGRKYIDAMYRRYGDRNLALMAYNWGPGNVDKWIKAGRPADAVPAETRKYVANVSKRAGSGASKQDAGAAADQGSSNTPMDYFSEMQKQFGPTDEEKQVDDARMARAKEMGSDEYYEKQRKEDMWSTLAQIGFNMASSKSPYLLQAIGEAAAAALPEARADKKERKALKDRALDVMADMNGQKRKENLQLYGIAVDAAQADIRARQAAEELDLRARDLEQRGDMAREQNASAETIAAMRPESLDFRESFAKSIFEDYKRRNTEGNLIVNGKRLPPNSKSDKELRVMAMQEVVNRMPKTQGIGTVDANFNGVPDTLEGSGGGQPAPDTSKYKVLGPE